MKSARLTACFTALLLTLPSLAAAQHHHHDDKPCHPSAKQRREAAQFARATKDATKKYESQLNAVDDHFEPWVDTWKPVYHYVNYEHYYDWKVLDPTRPEALVYAHTYTGEKLIGIMYSMEDPGRRPPDFGGCITRWHTHPQCKSPIGYSHIWEEDWGDCPPGWEEDEAGSEKMIHVWTVPMKEGPYAFEPDAKWNCWPRPAPC